MASQGVGGVVVEAVHVAAGQNNPQRSGSEDCGWSGMDVVVCLDREGLVGPRSLMLNGL